MYKWKHVARLLAVLALVFLGLHQFAVAMQAGAAQSNGFAGWQIEAISPSVRDLDFVTPTDGWATTTIDEYGGYKSLLYHYDGSKWRLIQTIDGIYARDIDMVSATDGWLIGYDDAIGTLAGGKLFRYNGSQWQPVLGPDGVYQSIQMLSTTDGYLISSTGLWHYNGSQWQRAGDGFYEYPLTSDRSIFDVTADGTKWYLARNYFGTVIYKFDGAAWQPILHDVDMRAFDMTSATEGWIAGAAGKIWRYSGGTLTPAASPATYELHAVTSLSSGEAWAVGWGDGLLHFDGAQWQKVAGSEARPQITMLSAAEGWLGMDLHFSAGTWHNVAAQIAPARAGGYHDEIFALGDSAAWTNSYYFDGQQWQTVPYTVPAALQPVGLDLNQVNGTYLGLDSIQMTGPASGWAIGSVEYSFYNPDKSDVADNLLFRYDGSGWEAVAGFNSELGHISVPATGEIWATGDAGILRFDGQQWQVVWQQGPPGTPYLSAISMLSAQEGWAAGRAFAHYNGQEWQITTLVSNTVTALDMVSAADGWAVGNGGKIWHYTGAAWQPAASPTTADLKDIDMVAADEGWAVGYRYSSGYPVTGVLLHYDGTAWQVAAELPSYSLYAVSMADKTRGRIAGDYGLILSLDTSTRGTIAGAVRSEQGQPLAGIAVHAYRNDGEWVEEGTGTTDAQGAYALTLPPGQYRLYFTAPGGAYRSEYYDNQATFGAATILDVRSGEVVSGTNAVLGPPPPPAISVSGPVATAIDQASGLVSVAAPRAGSGSVTFARAVTCSGGATPANVLLDISGKTFAMSGSGGLYAVTVNVPGDLPAGGGAFELRVRYTCGVEQLAPVVGQLMLYDPSGTIRDEKGEPVAGAVVSLHRIRSALPDLTDQQRDCRTVDTRPGGPTGDWSGVPPADGSAGALVNPALAEDAALIAPDVNPQITGADGRFGWDVATGCWYVTVAAQGYKPQNSPLVGVPPAVTDLNLDLTLEPDYLYLPALKK